MSDITNELFSLSYGPTGSDCTRRYDIKLKKECTVRDFMEKWMKAVLEWGYITIKFKDDVKGYGSYHYGEIIFPGISDDVLDSKIKHMRGSGGLGHSNFMFEI